MSNKLSQREDSHLEIDYDEFNESIVERVVALKNIISPMRRYKLQCAIVKSANSVRTASYYLGNFGYIISTSMILVMLPLAFEMQKDADFKDQLPDQQSNDLFNEQ